MELQFRCVARCRQSSYDARRSSDINCIETEVGWHGRTGKNVSAMREVKKQNHNIENRRYNHDVVSEMFSKCLNVNIYAIVAKIKHQKVSMLYISACYFIIHTVLRQ